MSPTSLHQRMMRNNGRGLVAHHFRDAKKMVSPGPTPKEGLAWTAGINARQRIARIASVANVNMTQRAASQKDTASYSELT